MNVTIDGVQFRLTGRRSKNRNINKSRRRLSKRVFGDCCFYCSGPVESFDHFFPFSLGGINKWRNLVPSCLRCNREKKGKFPAPQYVEKHKNLIEKAVAAGVISMEPPPRKRAQTQ